MGQSGDGGWLCGSAALYGYNWNCGGAASHPAWPALSLCHAGPAVQVQAHTGEKLLPTGIWLHAQFLSLSLWVSCVTGPHVCPSLSQSVAASCHWMHFETLRSEGFSSSCSERRQAQVGSQVRSALTHPRLLPAFLSSLHCTYDKGKKAPNNNNISDQHTVYLLFVSSVFLFKSKQQGQVAS